MNVKAAREIRKCDHRHCCNYFMSVISAYGRNTTRYCGERCNKLELAIRSKERKVLAHAA